MVVSPLDVVHGGGAMRVCRAVFFCLMSSAIFLAGCSHSPEVLQVNPKKGEDGKVKAARSPAMSVIAVNQILDSSDELAGSGAQTVLDDAIAEAKAVDKKLFVHFGAQW